jgi:CRP-like cAMP-binding protein
MERAMKSLTCGHPPNPDPQQNQLLAALPACEWQRLAPHLELVELEAGKVLCESSSPITYVYFPASAEISLVCTTAEGGTAEIAVIGRDGVVGICSILGGYTMLNRAVVQSAGIAFRMRASLIKAEVNGGGALLHLLLRYTQSLITQITQSAACNRHHDIDQRLARRLLTALDGANSSAFAMTQEGVASLLGVRREGITAAAFKLQKDGVIRYQRGHISVLDRSGLERRACECYAAVAKEHYRLLPRVPKGATVHSHVPLPAPLPVRSPAIAVPIMVLRTVVQHRLPVQRPRSAVQLGSRAM